MDRRQFLTAAGMVLMASVAGCARDQAGLPDVEEAEGPLGPDSTAEPTEERPYRIALLSDVHVQPADSVMARAVNVKLEKAVADLQKVKPDRWLANGDIADRGLTSEFEAFKKIMSKVTKPGRLLVNTGNHEFYDMQTTDDLSLERFRKAFGLKTPYSNHIIAGLHVVMLAQEQWKTAPYKPDWCWITPEQMTWFETVLDEHKERFTVVCMHQPLNETVTGSVGEGAFGGTNMAEQIYALLERHPQVRLWFSGHTHRRVEADGQVVVKKQTTFVGLGSTFYQISPSTTPGQRFKRDSDASQSRLLEIYPDRVVVRARDHVAGHWLDDLALAIPRT